VEYLAVVGAGFMGAGIAAISAQAGITTRLKDQNFEALGKGLKFCHDFFREKYRRRSLTQLEFQQSLDTISGGIDYSGAGRADLVIEAVFEDLALKQRVLGEVEQQMRPDAIFGSNTSSISIARIAEASRRPENVLGLHFFSPVARMPLLEIVVTSRTGPQAIATAVTYASQIDKTPIVVRDGAGFYTSRILAPYVSEALHVLEEGASIESIDRAMIRFGFPVGPLALLDEVGIDVANKVAHVLQEAFGERMKVAPSSEKIARDGRLGRKSGRGFYNYAGKQKKADAGLYNLLPGGHTRKPMAENEIQSRLALAMVNEAVLCLQEGILRSPRDGDLGGVLGLGFPPFRGGPFRYIDSAGAGKVLDELIRLEERFPARFKPAGLLADMARERRLFYPQEN
jgi:3-hydroxyacyl-CoA dehydrogenase/enoyl-CoA hydratase/3-hydroxybutyryl-CoA epimerase